MSMETRWPVRRLKLAELRLLPFNPKEPSEEALSRLRWSLSRLGMVEWIIVNSRSGNIVAGNARREVLIGMGMVEADCLVVDLDPDEENSLAIALNNPALQGQFDLAKLGPVLESIRANKDAALYESSGLRALETMMTDAIHRSADEKRSAREAIEHPVAPSPKIPLVEVQGIKMLQLQFTPEQAEQVVEMLGQVVTALGTDNASEAIYELLRRWTAGRA